MTARIYRPAKTAMQSGASKTKQWLLEFEASERRGVEPLMGYTSSTDMLSQVKLWFGSKEAALAYAGRNGIAAHVDEPKSPARRSMAYSDNFKYTRVGSWTH